MKWTLVLILICATTVGDVLRSIGMRYHGEIHDFRPGAIGRVLAALARNGYVIVSTLSMALSFFTFMKLVSIAPMSFAAAYIPETILARYVLHEDVDWRRWTGAVLIAMGVALVSQ
jgi:drug/metabolite transporter (DMT)-like permease